MNPWLNQSAYMFHYNGIDFKLFYFAQWSRAVHFNISPYW